MSRRYDWDQQAREAAALRKLSVSDVRGLSILRLLVMVRRPVLVVADRGKPSSSPSKDAIPDAAAWASKLESWGSS